MTPAIARASFLAIGARTPPLAARQPSGSATPAELAPPGSPEAAVRVAPDETRDTVVDIAA